MCGIIGIFAKSEALEASLGEHAAAMLRQLGGRGPDSAGVAFYRNPVAGHSKICLRFEDRGGRAAAVSAIEAGIGVVDWRPVADRHAVLVAPVTPEEAGAWLDRELPDAAVDSAGRAIEIYKETGSPAEFVARFELAGSTGRHALGHTRMATESRVTTEHSHPFSTGLDLCLVHNGSLSNHNQLRRELRREGIRFGTDNDTEVAAGYLTWRLREGATLEEALESCLVDARRLLHLRGRHRRRLRRAARPVRLQAGGDGRDRRLGGDGIRVPRDRDAARGGRRDRLGARPAARLQLAATGWRVSDDRGDRPARGRPRRTISLRELNARLHEPRRPARDWRVVNPGGEHAIAAGLDAAIEVEIDGHVGYYCAGMNQHATVTRARQLRRRRRREHDVGHGASSRATPARRPARARRGGLLVISGDAAARCGISMKGVDIVVRGSVGHMSAFMAQSGRIVVFGDAGDGARRLDLRGPRLRPRRRSPASAPTASRRRCARSTGRSWASCSSGRGRRGRPA